MVPENLEGLQVCSNRARLRRKKSSGRITWGGILYLVPMPAYLTC